MKEFNPDNYKKDGKKSRFEYNIYLDTETVCNPADGNRIKLVIGYCVIYDGEDNLVGKAEFHTPDEFFQILVRWLDKTDRPVKNKKPSPPVKIWAHNWNFDASSLLIGSAESRNKYKYTIPVSSGIHYNPERGGMSPFMLSLYFPRGEDDNPDSYTDKGDRKLRHVRLMDSTNFYKQPLGEVMECLGLFKEELASISQEGKEAEVTYNRFMKEPQVCRDLLRKRCQTDAEGLAAAMIALDNFGRDNFDTRPRSTIARMAVASFARSPEYADILDKMEAGPINTELKFVQEAIDSSYIGGRTESFYKGKPVKGRLWKYDVVSMYPSIMLDYVPTNYIHTVTDKKLIKRCINVCKKKQDLIYLALVDVDVPDTDDLGFEGHYHPSRGVCFFKGKINKKWIWEDTVEYGLERGYIKNIRKVMVFRAAPIFKDYIIRLAAMKKKYKDEGNKIMKLFCKLLMNALYGKFGGKANGKWVVEERADKLQMLRDRFAGRDRASVLLAGKDKFGNRMKEFYYRDLDGEWNRFISSEFIYDDASVPSIASYITSRARLKLLKSFHIIEEELGGRIYYCDTDSLITNIDLAKKKHPFIPIGDELGEWELEEGGDDEPLLANQCSFNAPKDYWTAKKVKMKGIRKPVRGVRDYEQEQFPNYSTILKRDSNKNIERIEQGGCIVKIKKSVGGKNHKRNEPQRGAGWTTAITASL